MGTWEGEAAATGMPQASVVAVAPTVAAPPAGVRKSDFTYTYIAGQCTCFLLSLNGTTPKKRRKNQNTHNTK